MNPPPQFPHGFQQPPPPSPPKRESQLVGPRPSPLKVSKDSHKIRKQPGHPPLPPAVHGRREEQFRQQRNEPVIIYAVSPKVIHATVADFMSIVQRLTGPSTSSSSPTGADLLSPAARLASIEKTSPSEREKPSSGDDFMDVVEGVEMGQFPSILSPAPATLPPISAEFFSPLSDPQTLSMLHDLSPFWQGNSFTASPSALLSAPLVSPSPSSLDIFNNFVDF
ncbi:protein MKS1 [Ziziphus jujuba]|uniref:Protein MKS1 n=2 Tax=Ziziphus jujuba TaxID=326968 RepID=A0A6P4B026_ZIZJJ|nr:protein MKS1 [Ziziphus jujuba]KAH7520822.1 hypothetical protein FEM48_Zijuj08G0186800 [Ziziphus jujuba var. spinosa]